MIKSYFRCMCVDVGYVSVLVFLCVPVYESQISASDTLKLHPQVTVSPSKWGLRSSLGFSARTGNAVKH